MSVIYLFMKRTKQSQKFIGSLVDEKAFYNQTWYISLLI